MIEPLEHRIAPATFVWNVNASGNWNDPANWSLVSGVLGPGFPNAVGDVARFHDVITTNRTVTIPSGVNITVGVIDFDDNNNYTIAAVATGRLTLDNTAVNAQIFASGTLGDGNHTISAPITLNDNAQAINNSTGLLTFSGAIGDLAGRGMTKLGNGTVRFAGTSANTFTGGVLVNGGTLELAKPANVVAIAGASLIIGDGTGGSGSDVVRLLSPGNISSGVQVAVETSGLLDLNGNNQDLFSLQVKSGDTSASQVTTGLGTLTNSSFSFQQTGTGTVAPSLSGRFDLEGATRQFSVPDGTAPVDLTIDGAILNGGIRKVGTSTIRLAGTESNAGLTGYLVDDGVLELAKTNGAVAIPAGGGLTIGNTTGADNSATVRMLGTQQLGAGLSVTINPDGTLNLAGSVESIGALSFSSGASDPEVTTGSGVLQVSSTILASGGTGGAKITGNLDLTAGSHDFNISGSGAAFELEIEGVISGPGILRKLGSGTLRLSGPVGNTFTGTTIVADGILELAKTPSVIFPTATSTSITVGDGGGNAGSAILRLADRDQIPNTAVVTLSSEGLLDLGGFDDTFGTLSLIGATTKLPTVVTGGAPLRVSAITATSAGVAFQPMKLTADIVNPTSLAVTVNETGQTVDLEIEGSIQTPSLSTSGPGTLRLSGATSNTITQAFTNGSGLIELAKTGGAVAFALGNFSLGSSNATVNTVRWLGPGQIANGTSLSLSGPSLLDLNGHDFTSGSITFFLSASAAQSAGRPEVSTGAGTLTFGGNPNVFSSSLPNILPARITGNVDSGATPITIVTGGPGNSGTVVNLDIAATLTGTQPITIFSGGVRLSGTESLNAPINIDGGALFADTAIDSLVLNGGTLRGNSSVSALTSAATGTVNPGTTGPGVLTADGAAFAATNTLAFDVNGTTPGTTHDQLVVNGPLDLGNAQLALTSTTLPAGNQEIVIIANDGTDAVFGTFGSLAEGADITVGTQLFRITYVGGDGNDVALTRLIPTVTLVKPNVVTFTDLDGDLVTIKTTKGVFTAENFTLEPISGGSTNAQLQLVDITTGGFAGTALTITAKRTASGGNGVANVGFINALGVDLASVTVSGDLGRIVAGDGNADKPAIGKLTVGSLGQLGTATQAAGGTLLSSFDGLAKTITIRNDLRNANVTATSFGSVNIKGSLIAGELHTANDFSSLAVTHDIVGTAADPVVITAFGKATAPLKGADLAIGKVKVGGRMEFARLLAGFDPAGLGTNTDAGIGSVTVKGDFIASSILAGAEDGIDNVFGTADDTKFTAPLRDNAAIFSQIASLVIGGQALGTATAGDAFSITAELIKSVKIGPAKLPLTKGERSAADLFPVAPTGPGPTALPSDLVLNEISA